MADHKELENLHEKLLNRKCHTMADVIAGGLDGKEGQSSSEIVKSFGNSAFMQSFKKSSHAKSTDTTAAINELSNIVIDAAAPDAIGRELVRVIETTKESLKVRLPSRGVAVDGDGRGTKGNSRGQRESYVTLTPDKELEVSEEWDRSFIEDADWDVASEEAAELSRALQEKESAMIITHLEAVSAGSLAGGANVGAATAGTLTFDDLATLWGTVKAENFTPNVVAMHPDQATDLFKDSDFKNQLILGEFLNYEEGKFGRTILGFDILVSSLVTAQRVLMLDSTKTLLYALRRDSLSIPYEKPPNISGMQISSRYDKQDGRSAAFARMIDA